MNTQPHLIREWTLISQWLSQLSLSPVSRRSVLCIGIVALACGFCLLSLSVLPVPGASALHILSQWAFHLIGRIPFGEPFPP